MPGSYLKGRRNLSLANIYHYSIFLIMMRRQLRISKLYLPQSYHEGGIRSIIFLIANLERGLSLLQGMIKLA